MQLTRFDRWLRETFVYETHIHTMRELDPRPRGFACVALPEKPGQRYRFQYITRSTKAADKLVRHLREQGMMFDTRVVNRKGWHVRFLAPEGKSLTWWLFSMVFVILSLGSLAYGAKKLWDNPEIRKNILESIEIFKG
jgi:hypothetical protein